MKKIINIFLTISIIFSMLALSSVNANATNTHEVVEYAKQLIGTPYVYGGTSLSLGIDCGAFVCRVYEKFGIDLWKYRTSLTKATVNNGIATIVGTSLNDISKAQPGDLIHFPGHVAIYVGDKKVIHAVSKGVSIAELSNTGYWGGTGKKVDRIVRLNGVINTTTQSKPVESTLSINCTQYPSSIKKGSSFGLRGDISSNYNITSVKGYIINSNGTYVQTTSDSPNSTYFNIRSGKLNTNMIFGDLSVGNYIFKIVAGDSSGKTKTFEQAFSVVERNNSQVVATQPSQLGQQSVSTSIEYTQTRSALQIDPWSYPSGTLQQGKSFKLSGRIKSDSHLTLVRSYMLDANKNVIMTGSGSTTTKTYIIEGYGLDKGMKFGQLSAGTYYLRYYAEDANGGKTTWTSPAFHVK